MSVAADGPFSHPSRVALIAAYFENRRVQSHEAWKDVYRLLLWADGTTGLAHCYESDKAQPGRPWYARTLRFHAWLADQFSVDSLELADHLDWMLRAVIDRVAAQETDRSQALWARSASQLLEIENPMPVPGDDPELRQLIEPLLPADEALRPDDLTVRNVLRQLRAYITSENKRKNLLGRGFEDVLAGIIQRLDISSPPHVGTQTLIHEIPGFRPVRKGDKEEKVDLWVHTATGHRVMVTAKWSVRADREKQMAGDFQTYVAANELREPFEYVFITNEFDPARLVANATNTVGNQYLFNAVVHVCPPALAIVHELDRPGLSRTPAALKEQLDHGRIIGLDAWLNRITA